MGGFSPMLVCSGQAAAAGATHLPLSLAPSDVPLLAPAADSFQIGPWHISRRAEHWQVWSAPITSTDAHGLELASEATTNFLSWTSLTSFVYTAFPFTFADAAASNFPLRFYRVVQPPIP